MLKVVSIKQRERYNVTVQRFSLNQFRRSSIMFFSTEDTNVLSSFVRRGTEPYREYRKLVPAILRDLGIADKVTKVRWDRRAGCSMCPCSPGFILEGLLDDDIHVTVAGDVAKPDYTPEQSQRAAALSQQM